MLHETEGVYDNVRVKRQSLVLTTVFAKQLLLVDEVMRATLVLLPSVGF
jgi:chaperonin GroEL (HSP60 family)